MPLLEEIIIDGELAVSHIDLLEKLQQTAESIVGKINYKRRIEKCDPILWSLLEKKQKQLMKFSQLIQDELNDFIEPNNEIEKKIKSFYRILCFEHLSGLHLLTTIEKDHLKFCVEKAKNDGLGSLSSEKGHVITCAKLVQKNDFCDAEIDCLHELAQSAKKDLSVYVDFYEQPLTLAELQEKPEIQIRKNLKEHFFKLENQHLNEQFLRDLLQRFEANLTADDLLKGVDELLQIHNIKIDKKGLFDNFILGCKLLFDVRKNAFFSATHPSLNYLPYHMRRALKIWMSHVKDELYNETRTIIKRFPNPYLNKLKIKVEGFLNKSMEALDIFGICDCGEGSVDGLKRSLKLRMPKSVELTGFLRNTGDHGFLFLNSLNAINSDEAITIDIWAGEVYALALLKEKLHDYVCDEDKCLNLVEKYDAKKNKLTTYYTSTDMPEVPLKRVRKQALAAFNKLQIATEMASSVIAQQLDKYELTPAQQKSLNTKIEELSDYVDNIDFVIQNTIEVQCKQFENPDNSQRIILIDEFNEIIEDFYQKLMNILIAHEAKSSFFVDKAIRSLLNLARAEAEKQILSDELPSKITQNTKAPHFSV